MSCVLASQYGWKQSDIEFVINHNFDNLRKSVNDQTTAACQSYRIYNRRILNKK
jgi:hypothetical protein